MTWIASGLWAFHPATADRAVLARVLAASHADQQPAPPRGSYLADLAARLAGGLAQATERLNLSLWLLVGVPLLLALVALALLVRIWRARRRAALAAGPAIAAAAAPTEERGGAPAGAAGGGSWDAFEWRREIDRQLAEGRVAEALRATWWWLARSLAGEAAEPTWTGRELLRWSRREDLRQLLRQLDLMAYGPRRPAAGEVRGLTQRLEAALR
jgi:hypothetical protein